MGSNPRFEEIAVRLGEVFLERGVSLVYGGGRTGLMGKISDTIFKGGGEVIGVIPTFLEKLEVANTNVSELIVTDNMHNRKQIMYDRSDGFITMPGGIGTLEETFEIATWRQLKIHSKPVIVLNVEGYWSGLSKILNEIVLSGFGSPEINELVRVVNTPEEVFKVLEN
jgi:uncharacterized protein (TIGR00730 family)